MTAVEDNDDLAAAREVAAQDGSIDLEFVTAPSGDIEGAIEPVTAILIGTGVIAAAKFIVEWWERRRGGLIIDQRKDVKDWVYRKKDVPYGFVLIFPADGGTVKVETKDSPKDSIQQLIEAVIDGVLKSANGIAEAAAKIVGGDKVEVDETAVARAT